MGCLTKGNGDLKYDGFLFWEFDWLYREFKRLEFVQSQKYVTLKAALNMLLQNNGKIIVETGTQRMIDDPGGCSTLLFGAFCSRYDKHLYTVDVNPQNLEVAKQATKQYENHITYILSNSVEFLNDFNEPIDLLYLDSLDCPADGDALESQTHNLNELKAAYKNLHVGSIILIDDNSFVNGGKSRFSKRFLLKSNEWTCILDYGQTLWIKGLQVNI